MAEAVKIRSIALWALIACGVSVAATPSPTSASTFQTGDSDALSDIYPRLDKLGNGMAGIIFLRCSEGLNREEFDARFSRCVRNALPTFETLSHVSGYIVRTYCDPGSVYLSNQKMCTCLNNLYNADLRLAGDSRPLHRHDGGCGQHNNRFSSIEEMQSALIRQTAIFGEDDRGRVDLTSDEVFSVGSIKCYDAYGFSGTSSAAVVKVRSKEEGDVILTAEHVLRNMETGVVKESCVFRPGHSPYVGLPIDMGKIIYGDEFRTKNLADDWAVAGLTSILLVTQEGKTTEKKKQIHLGYSPMPLIGAPNSGMTLDEPVVGRPIELYGFNRDTRRMSVSDRCTIQAKKPYGFYYENARINIHDCDAVGGSSGGVLTTLNSQMQRVIVGIQVLEGSNNELDRNSQNKFDAYQTVNVAVVINERILQAIESF